MRAILETFRGVLVPVLGVAASCSLGACIHRSDEPSVVRDERPEGLAPWVALVRSTPREARLAMFPLTSSLVAQGRLLWSTPQSGEGSRFAEVMAPRMERARAELRRSPRHVRKKTEAQGWSELSALFPGAGPRDYVSFARYAWPDPEKPGGIPYRTIDGKANRELIKRGDSPALASMLDALEDLTLAYAYTGEDDFARKADETLVAWFLSSETGMNPHLRYGQIRLGEPQGTPAGLIDVRGFFVIPEVVSILSASRAFRPETRQGVESWFRAWFSWLESDPIGKKEIAARNNHGSFMALQRIAWSHYFGQLGQAQSLCGDLAQLAGEQIAPDGSQPLEARRAGSFHYHIFNLHALLLGNELCREAGVAWEGLVPHQGLGKAVGFVAPAFTGAAAWPLMQNEFFDKRSFQETAALLRWSEKLR